MAQETVLEVIKSQKTKKASIFKQFIVFSCYLFEFKAEIFDLNRSPVCRTLRHTCLGFLSFSSKFKSKINTKTIQNTFKEILV